MGRNEKSINLTAGQKVILGKMLKMASRKNEAGKGYRTGSGYNQSWHKVEAYAIQTKRLVSVPKKGLFVKGSKVTKSKQVN
jgi:hypothetical protein